ncbi:hypothetical protein MalM25_34670 [Planctomycetes bacterium MalM25]|nr:hypothetical protein MalM25_34670 [Planctomycetes bacterium MalM25]
MRLTLRTLLSYLDNVLDDPSRAELERQIESNENASEWIHRTRDVMRRLKLGAPDVDGASSVDDPNTVAEYLDRTLPEESVAEFERVCLESDAMLAEVASCHRVLAMVLAERPDVDPDTQKRLHRLQADLAEATRSRVETAHPKPMAAESPRTPEPAPNPGRPEKPVPEYLRQQDEGSWLRWAPAIAALLLLAITAGLAFRPGGWLNPAPQVAKQDGEPLVVPELADDLQEAAGEAEGTADDATEPVANPAESEGTEQETPSEATGDGEELVDESETEITSEPEATSKSEPDTEVPVEVTDPADPAEEVMEEPANEAAADQPEVLDDPTPEDPEPALPEFTPPPIRYLSAADQIGLREIEPGSWRRLEIDAELSEPTRFVSAPTYRNAFVLGPGVGAELVDLTVAVLSPSPDAETPPRVELTYGRLVLSQEGDSEEPVTVEVVIDSVPYAATLGPGAVLAIAADRPFDSGHPALEARAPLVAMAHGLAGTIEWSSADVGLKTTKPRPWIIVGDEAARIPAALSDAGWVDRLEVSPADRYAQPELARGLLTGEPVWPQLLVVAGEESFQEVRSLAARAAAAVGHPDPLVDSFRLAKESARWRENLQMLRDTASRSVAQAGEIQRVFGEMFGERTAEELIDMVIGFRDEEIGFDAETVARGVLPEVIVPALKSDDLATRVLASLVLEDAIEPMERPYRPLDSARKRLQAIRRVEKQLLDGDLTPRGR